MMRMAARPLGLAQRYLCRRAAGSGETKGRVGKANESRSEGIDCKNWPSDEMPSSTSRMVVLNTCTLLCRIAMLCIVGNLGDGGDGD